MHTVARKLEVGRVVGSFVMLLDDKHGDVKLRRVFSRET